MNMGTSPWRTLLERVTLRRNPTPRETSRHNVRLLHRLAAALSAVLILQLTLLGSGTLCPMRGGDAAKSHDMSTMDRTAKSRDTAATPAVGVPAVDGTELPPASSRPLGGHRLPWTPGECTSMTACTVSAIPAPVQVVALGTHAIITELPVPAGLGSRPASPPELPPPRA